MMASISPSVCWIALVWSLLAVTAVPAQTSVDDPPKVLKANPKQNKDKQQESLKLFALGLLCEQEDRLLEALDAFEKAAELDPKAAPVLKKLLAFYSALDRGTDALAVCEKILDLDAMDVHIWHLYAQQLQNKGKTEEALAALKKGLKNLDTDKDLDLGQQMYFDLGKMQADANQPLPAANSFVESAKLLKRALKELPLEKIQKNEIQVRLASLYERVGKIHLGLKDYEKAIAAYQEAQKNDPLGGDRWHLNLAQIFQTQGKFSDALDSVDIYLKLQPQGVEAYELKIALLEKLGKKADVLPWLSQASQKDQFNVTLRLLLADQYSRFQEMPKAQAIYLDLAQQSPKAEIFTKLFQVYKKTPGSGLLKVVELLDKKMDQIDGKDLPTANQAKMQAQAMLAALKSDPDLTRELLKIALPLLNDPMKDLNLQTVSVLALLADQQHDLIGAESFFKAALKKITPQTETVVYEGLLRVLLKAKKYQDVIVLCQDGLQKAQATSQLLFRQRLAVAYARLNKMDLALAEAKKAIDIAPASRLLDMQTLYVNLLSKNKQFDQAEAECHKLLKINKQPGEIVSIRLLLSEVYSAAQNFPKAENELQLILKADPTNATAYNNLGYNWADQGKNLKEAEEMIRKALDLDRDQRKTIGTPEVDPAQDNFAYVDSLGWVLFRQNKLDEARKELERASKLPGADEDPTVWDHLGDVYHKLNMTPQAQQCWQKALTLYEDEQARPLDQHYKDLKAKIQLLKTSNSD